MMAKFASKTLYEQDYHWWIEATVQQLRARAIEELDWENLMRRLNRWEEAIDEMKSEQFLLHVIQKAVL
jgi:hypothetical protein